MRFCGEMHHHIVGGDQLIHRLGIADIALYQLDRCGDRSQRLAGTGVSQRVENGHRDIGALTDGRMYEVGSDETGAAGHQDSHALTLVGDYRSVSANEVNVSTNPLSPRT